MAFERAIRRRWHVGRRFQSSCQPEDRMATDLHTILKAEFSMLASRLRLNSAYVYRVTQYQLPPNRQS